MKKMIDMKLELEDSRRLTGPNIFGKITGGIIDVNIEGIEIDVIVKTWEKHAQQLLERVFWHREKCFPRVFEGGASLLISAPIDCLYATVEINEAAWELTRREILQIPFEDFTTALAEIINTLKTAVEAEKNPKLIAVQEMAAEKGVVFLSDDDQASIGYGASCQVFDVNKLPDVEDINWQAASSIPVALITGTNGKSTSVRLASSIVAAAGKSCGITSTDYIRVGKEIIDTGDYSGPGGARMLLRHPKTEIAFLEVARGGLLRRGIGINDATAVLITNVSEDHLGQYGINNLSDMVEAKFIVRQAISKQQHLILNADDEACVTFAKTLKNTLVWFSWSSDNPTIQQHLKEGGIACYVEDDTLVYHTQENKQTITAVNDIPITLNGAAKHNTHNALGVVALCFAMGFGRQDISKGLQQFGHSPEDNPGRGNLFNKDGYQVILDFAHNYHGLSQMAQTIKAMPAKRRLIMLGQPGDRSNDLIEKFVTSALEADPDQLIIIESETYLRGRERGEVPQLIQKFALQQGMKQQQISFAESTLEGTKEALQQAQADDLILLLAFDHRDEVIQLLE